MTTGLAHTHMLMAMLTIAVFVLQGILALAAPGVLRHKAMRIIPHVIYTLLLVTALTLLVVHGWNPFAFGWITMKIILLIAFIGLGIIAFRPNFPPATRAACWVVALGALLWAYSSALTRSAFPFA
jgi:uncharacterized membrane protein SirB2